MKYGQSNCSVVHNFVQDDKKHQSINDTKTVHSSNQSTSHHRKMKIDQSTTSSKSSPMMIRTYETISKTITFVSNNISMDKDFFVILVMINDV